MEEHALVSEGARQALPRSIRPSGRLARGRREEEPHVAVVLFRWLVLYAIVLSAFWAFLTSPAVD